MGNKLYFFFFGTRKKFFATLLIGIVVFIATVVEMEFPGVLVSMTRSFPGITIPLLMSGMVLFGVVAWMFDEFKEWNKRRGQ